MISEDTLSSIFYGFETINYGLNAECRLGEHKILVEASNVEPTQRILSPRK